ncbi:hypothetical protein [Methanocaldococcus sp.]|uniref:hypothetical protein n=1 Tax=Methanocaldococcus sp. TaxID=2152917 RepID=UPI00261DD3CB|nr:hypothetical protein [Methanocaldococcus sp.]MCQ6254135.1 hypothetical protein [Methanocaldococcus sp.]
MDKKASKFNIGIFTVIGTIIGGLFGYLCVIYYLIFIEPNLNIPSKFRPLISFLLFAFILLLILLFNYLGACFDDESRAVKEFKKFKIVIGSLIVGTIMYSIILLIVILYGSSGLINYLYGLNGKMVSSIIGMVVILCSYLLIRTFLVND